MDLRRVVTCGLRRIVYGLMIPKEGNRLTARQVTDKEHGDLYLTQPESVDAEFDTMLTKYTIHS